MAGAAIGSAALGSALELTFDGFLNAILTARKYNSIFNPTLESLEETLKSMETSVRRIDSFSRDPREIDGLKELMQKGENLVKRCSSIHKYDIVRKPFYAGELLKLDKSIRRYISTVLQLQQAADGKETLFEVKQLKQLVVGGFGRGSGNGSLGGVGLVGFCFVPEMKVNPVGLEVPLREVKRRVLDDGVSLLVLSAAGGCGKTTLVTAFCHDSQVKAKFRENIFFVTVSKSPNLLVIVNRLCQHKGYMALDFGSEEDAIVQLEIVLKQLGPSPILLVLDDVWSGSESLIEKLRFRIDNYQILVTSRFEFLRFNSTYKLPKLNKPDSMHLFRQLAFLPNGNTYEPDKDIVEKIVEACKGFPLAISVMAKSLCGKPAAEWRKRAKECAKSVSLQDNFELLQCLQSSVDALNDKPVVKECYLDLGSFPKGQRIPADILVDMWAELHGLDEDDAISNLYELSNRSLLDLVVTRKDANEDDSSYSDLFVMQHDLLKDLAILLSETGATETRKRVFMNIDGNQYSGWGINDMKTFSSATLLSINTDERFPPIWFNVEAPQVQVLLLNFQSKNYILPQFIQRMESLRVLTITNCGFVPVELSNFHYLRSLSNLKRLRFERTTMPSLSLTCMQYLSKLEKLSFVMCNIGQAFSESSIQFSTALPNLLEINIDYCNDLVALPEGFCDLPKLKKLRITNCHKLIALPGRLGNLVNLEVLRLNSCCDLAELPDSIGGLRNLRVMDLSECFRLKKLPEQTGDLCNLRKLYMIDCISCGLPRSVRNLVNLTKVFGDEETASSWKMFKPFLPQLEIKVHKDINLQWLGDDFF